jgi:uncharacterized integral membrane protein
MGNRGGGMKKRKIKKLWVVIATGIIAVLFVLFFILGRKSLPNDGELFI